MELRKEKSTGLSPFLSYRDLSRGDTFRWDKSNCTHLAMRLAPYDGHVWITGHESGIRFKIRDVGKAVVLVTAHVVEEV